MGTQLAGALTLDGNGFPLPFSNNELYEDGGAQLPVLAITNVSLTSNVATFTYTPGTWQPFIGQKVDIAACGSIYNGAGQVITAITYASHTFTIAITHADDGGGAVTGTATPKNTDSVLSTGTSDEVCLVAPQNATELEVYCSGVVTRRKVSGGATLGTWSIQATTIIKIACQPGDRIFIFRTNASTINFRFKALQ